MHRLLFIHGFNTATSDTYSVFATFFRLSGISVVYFKYAPSEELDSVVDRLTTTITTGSYDTILGHSMGGGLLLTYLTNNGICSDTSYIFAMPLITRTPLLALYASVMNNLYLPKCICLPNHSLYEHGNILNDSWKLVSLHQPLAIQVHIPHMDKSILSHPNCILIYARNELLNIISPIELATIRDVRLVSGKHECFNEASHTRDFFKTLTRVLRVKKVIKRIK